MLQAHKLGTSLSNKNRDALSTLIVNFCVQAEVITAVPHRTDKNKVEVAVARENAKLNEQNVSFV